MDLAHKTLLVTSMIAAPLLLIAMLAGWLSACCRPPPRSPKSTLSFIPKLLLLVLTLFAAAVSLRVLIDFHRDLYASIPSMIG